MSEKNFQMQFKPELNLRDLTRLTRNLMFVLTDFITYCQKRNLPCLITSLMEDAPGRKSTTHQTGRAFDASVRGWTEVEVYKCQHFFNKTYPNIGTAPKGKPPKVCVVHSATHEGKVLPKHFHFQVRWE